MDFVYYPPSEPTIPINENLMLFYSYPDYSGNSLALYEYIISNTMYETVWVVVDLDILNLLNKKKVKCFLRDDIIEGEKWVTQAKYVFSTHGFEFIRTKYKGQIFISLGHSLILSRDQFGNENWLKGGLQWGKMRSTQADIHTVTSGLTRILDAGSFFYDARKAIITGQPRCDLLFSENGLINLRKLFPNLLDQYKLFILYAPTTRRGKAIPDKIGNAFINNIFNFDNFNQSRFEDFLEQKKICIIIKFHPDDEEKNIETSINIPSHCYVINSKLLSKQFISLYHILNSFDIMLGDTSTLTFEYLLLNRPIIRIFNEFPELERVVDPGHGNPDFWYPGERVTDQEELEAAISSAIINPEKYSHEFITVKELLFKYSDGNSSARVLDAIKNYKSIDNIEYEMYTNVPLNQLSKLQNELINTQSLYQNINAELVTLKKSKTYKFVLHIKNVLFPKNSIRNKIFKKLLKFINIFR